MADRLNLVVKGLMPVDAGVQLQRGVDAWNSHVMHGDVTGPNAVHDVIPGPLDRRAIGTQLMNEPGRLDHPLTGRNVRGQAHPDPNRNNTQINAEPGLHRLHSYESHPVTQR